MPIRLGCSRCCGKEPHCFTQVLCSQLGSAPQEDWSLTGFQPWTGGQADASPVGMQIPGGWAAQRWGGRNTLALSFALWSTAVLVTPSSGKEVRLILCVRVLVGVAQGLIIPSIHTVLAQVQHCNSLVLQYSADPGV